MTHRVFISHARQDRAFADAVCAALEAGGTPCWIAPRNILPGADWGSSIVQAIKDSQVLLLVLSDSANRSPHVGREVERAGNLGLTVLPVRIEDVLPSGSLEYHLGTLHWLDAFGDPVQHHLDRVVHTVHTILDLPARPLERPPPEPRPIAPGRAASPPAPPQRPEFGQTSQPVAPVPVDEVRARALLAAAGFTWVTAWFVRVIKGGDERIPGWEAYRTATTAIVDSTDSLGSAAMSASWFLSAQTNFLWLFGAAAMVGSLRPGAPLTRSVRGLAPACWLATLLNLQWLQFGDDLRLGYFMWVLGFALLALAAAQLLQARAPAPGGPLAAIGLRSSRSRRMVGAALAALVLYHSLMLLGKGSSPVSGSEAPAVTP